jgi:hypothetical protein
MPLLPPTTCCQADSRSLPTGEMIPMPVTTTRLLDIGGLLYVGGEYLYRRRARLTNPH